MGLPYKVQEYTFTDNQKFTRIVDTTDTTISPTRPCRKLMSTTGETVG